MLYAKKGTREFRNEELDLTLVVKEEPTGSQYDERQALLGAMRIPGNVISENTNMEELFANGEMVEINVDKKRLAEFQVKAVFVSMTLPSGKTLTSVSDLLGEYRQFSRSAKEWIDEQVDSVWKSHEEDVKEIAKQEGNSEG